MARIQLLYKDSETGVLSLNKEIDSEIDEDLLSNSPPTIIKHDNKYYTYNDYNDYYENEDDYYEFVETQVIEVIIQ